MLLDDFLPTYNFNERHSIVITAPQHNITAALKELTPSELSPMFQALFTIRDLPARLTARPGKGLLPDEPLLDQLFAADFTLLQETEREIVFGIVGKFWELSPANDFKLATAQDFLKFDHPDYAKAIANFTISPKDDDSFVVITETRIHIAEEKARRKFALYWVFIYPGSAWIRRMWLKAIKRRAEKTSQAFARAA